MKRSALSRAAAVLGDRAERNYPIGRLTTYRVGGPAALYLEVRDGDDLGLLARALRHGDIPVMVIGLGSNLLVSDEGFGGIAVRLGKAFDWVGVTGTSIRAGGAASLPVVARRSAAAGLTGFEWAVGVPGSVGGALRMNAGGHGSDVRATLSAALLLDLAHRELQQVPPEELDLGYRSSSLMPTDIVLSAEFALQRGDAAESEAKIGEIVRWRREHQPGGPNAGSVFTNPPGDSAGRLIDESGLKGLRHGSAEVSPKHANFIQVDPGGSADDVWHLIHAVQARVFDHTGVQLHPELHLCGFPQPSTSTGG